MNISFKTPHFLDRFQPSETAVLIGTAIVVGIGTGFGAVGFIALIGFIQNTFFIGGEQLLPFLGYALIIIIPMIGGLLSGPIISFFASEAKGHGVPEVMQAIALRGGRIRPRVVVAKIIASALCIGSGGSAGREGPIVQVGAALGSSLGQWLKLSDNRIRNLVACGAAAGIAATFNAPIAGVIFAMEIILGELHLGDLGNVVISAVTASTIARIFLGDQPAFAITADYGIQAPWEIFLYVLLGVLAAVTAIGFTRVLYWFEDKFDAWKFPSALKPAVGGLLLGLLAFAFGTYAINGSSAGLPIAENMPYIFGAGFGVIESALSGSFPFWLLFVLIFLKPLATSFSLGSGGSGGVFAPGLFTGAVLGGALGKLLEILLPGADINSGAFAIAGMAAVFAGAARAPFTAILIVFEMTDDYRMIVPLMATVVTSLVVAERLMKDSIYTLKLSRRGIRIQRGRDVDVMESVRVDEVMVKEPIIVSDNMPITVLAENFIETGRHGFPVLDKHGQLLGVVSLEDYRNAVSEGTEGTGDLTVGEIATRDIITVYPDETVGSALRKMAPRDISRLPVISRENPRDLLGMIRRNDIVRAYEVGATRQEEERLRTSHSHIKESSGFAPIEMRIESGSISAGKKISEIQWPPEAVVVSVRRG
ncbi:MAG TPA: chloride channel protein, partial [Anaerolineales bacterium]|nr:chloride channel protein [Anaerolineales bacterium]